MSPVNLMPLARMSRRDAIVPPARREPSGRPEKTDVAAAAGRPGSELQPGMRERFGRQFGADFSMVRVHTDPAAAASAVQVGAAAYTVGTDIVAGPRFDPHTAAGQRLLAHELAHVVQQSQQSTQGTAVPDALERDADQAAEAALAGRAAPIRAASGPAVQRQAAADPFDALRTPQKTVTAAEAKAMLDHYEKLPEHGRDAIVQAFHHPGVLGSDLSRWLAALDGKELERRRALVSDIAERVQRLTVEGQTGKNLAQLAEAQAAFMRKGETQLAEKEATTEAKKSGQPPKPVTPADLARVHKEEAERTSPIGTASKTGLTDEEMAKWTARANKVIAEVVEACHKEAPELGITAANLRWDPEQVLGHGRNVYALSGYPLTFGTAFIETAEANPAYVVRTVVHEARGHPDFGNRFGSYEARIYDEAQKKHPELGGPITDKPDRDIYGYIGTEIYAALREIPYERPLSTVAAAKGLTRAISPEENVDNKIGLIKSKYAPGIAEAVLQGLYERFRIDPRISQDALALFESTAGDYFPGVLKGVPKRGPALGLDLGAGVGLERAGSRSLAYTTIDANLALRWSNVALSAGVRFEAPVNDRDSFIRLGVQSKVHARLFGSLYGDLRGGYVWGVSGGASSGLTVGAGVSYDLGRFELGLVYDYLKAADAKDPDAHRAFVSIGLHL